MFERDFTYKDLERVETEMANMYVALANIYRNKSYIWKISRTLDKLKNLNFSSKERYIIDRFESKYVKHMDRTYEVFNFLQKFTEKEDFKILSDTARSLINEIERYLLVLKQDNIYSANRTAFKTTIIRYIKSIKILKIQKEIVKKLIESIDVEDRKKLYIEFLKNEGEIYRIYNNLPDKFIKDKTTCINHVSNAMLSDAKEIITKGIKYKILSVLSFVVFGALLCMPYFLYLRRMPEISIGSIPISLVAVFAIGIFLTLYLYIILFLQNYFLFRSWYESKNEIKYCFIVVDFVAILLMAFLPLIYYKLDLSSSSYECLSDIGCLFKTCLGLYGVLLVCFFCKFWLDNKDELNNIFLVALLIFISDLLILLAIYFNYADEYILVIVLMVILHFLVRLLQIGKRFTYRILLVALSFMALVLLLSTSGFFVRVVGLANYQTDFDIKKENIPEYVNLENINKCKNTQDKDINFIKYTCISDEMPSSTVKFKNILIKVKSDGRYWLEVVAKDQNKSKIDDYRFWISEKNVIN